MDLDELERRFLAAPLPANSPGWVRAIVLRKGGGVHEQVARAVLDASRGVVGDRWVQGTTPDPDHQVSLIERRVVEVVAGGSAQLPGDNLIVDLDLSTSALPAGTRLRVGSAILEITNAVHAGCDKFRDRYGDHALHWVNAREHRDRRLRGVMARIVDGGEVAIGDRIERA